MHAALDPRISEFATREEADAYDVWFRAKVQAARQAPSVSHAKALEHFARKRAQRMEKLRHADD